MCTNKLNVTIIPYIACYKTGGQYDIQSEFITNSDSVTINSSNTNTKITFNGIAKFSKCDCYFETRFTAAINVKTKELNNNIEKYLENPQINIVEISTNTLTVDFPNENLNNSLLNIIDEDGFINIQAVTTSSIKTVYLNLE